MGDLAPDGMSLDIAPTPSGPASEPTEPEKVLAMLAHLLAFFCGGIIAPLVILAVKRNSKFVAFHAAQALLIGMAWVGVLLMTLFGTMGFTTARSAQPVARAPLAPPPAELLFMLLWAAAWMVTAVVFAVRAKGGHWSALPGFGWLARRMAGMGPLFLAVAAGLGTLSVTRDASAFGPGPLDTIEIAAKAGGGTNPVSGGPNALGIGVGLRGGASFSGFYGGLSFMDYLGSSQEVPAAGGGSTRYAVSSILVGIEGGYEIHVSLFTLRPQVGVGSYTLNQTESDSNNSGSLYLEPGVTGLLTFGRWIVGVDASVLFLPWLSGAQPAFTAHGQVGFKF